MLQMPQVAMWAHNTNNEGVQEMHILYGLEVLNQNWATFNFNNSIL